MNRLLTLSAAGFCFLLGMQTARAAQAINASVPAPAPALLQVDDESDNVTVADVEMAIYRLDSAIAQLEQQTNRRTALCSVFWMETQIGDEAGNYAQQQYYYYQRFHDMTSQVISAVRDQLRNICEEKLANLKSGGIDAKYVLEELNQTYDQLQNEQTAFDNEWQGAMASADVRYNNYVMLLDRVLGVADEVAEYEYFCKQRLNRYTPRFVPASAMWAQEVDMYQGELNDMVSEVKEFIYNLKGFLAECFAQGQDLSANSYAAEAVSQLVDRMATLRTYDNYNWNQLLDNYSSDLYFGDGDSQANELFALLLSKEIQVDRVGRNIDRVLNVSPYFISDEAKRTVNNYFRDVVEAGRNIREGLELSISNRSLLNAYEAIKREIEAYPGSDEFDHAINECNDAEYAAVMNQSAYNQLMPQLADVENKLSTLMQDVDANLSLVASVAPEDEVNQIITCFYDQWTNVINDLDEVKENIKNYYTECNLSGQLKNCNKSIENALDKAILYVREFTTDCHNLATYSGMAPDDLTLGELMLNVVSVVNMCSELRTTMNILDAWKPSWVSESTTGYAWDDVEEALAVVEQDAVSAIATFASLRGKDGGLTDEDVSECETIINNLLNKYTAACNSLNTFYDSCGEGRYNYDVLSARALTERQYIGAFNEAAKRMHWTATVLNTSLMLVSDDFDDKENLETSIEQSLAALGVELENAHLELLAFIEDINGSADGLSNEFKVFVFNCNDLLSHYNGVFRSIFEAQNATNAPLYAAYRDTDLALRDVEMALQLEEYDLLAWQAVLAGLGETDGVEDMMTKHMGLMAANRNLFDELKARAEKAYADGDAESYEWANIKAEAKNLAEQHADDAAIYRTIWQNFIRYNAADDCVADGHILAAEIYHLSLYTAQVGQRVADIRTLFEGQKPRTNENTAFAEVDDAIGNALLELRTGWQLVKYIHDIPAKADAKKAIDGVVTRIYTVINDLNETYDACLSNYMEDAPAALDPESSEGRYAAVMCAMNARSTQLAAMAELGNIFGSLLEQNVDEVLAEALLHEAANYSQAHFRDLDYIAEEVDNVYGEKPADLDVFLENALKQTMPQFSESFANESESLVLAWYDMQTPLNYLVSQPVVGNYNATGAPAVVESPVSLVGSGYFDEISFRVTLPFGQTADEWANVVTLAPALADATITFQPAPNRTNAVVTIKSPEGQYITAGLLAKVKTSVTTKGEAYAAVSDATISVEDFNVRPHGMTLLPIRGIVLDESDLTGDNAFDANDVEAISEILAADPTTLTDEKKGKADINGDGKVTIGDITTAIRLLNEEQ